MRMASVAPLVPTSLESATELGQRTEQAAVPADTYNAGQLALARTCLVQVQGGFQHGREGIDAFMRHKILASYALTETLLQTVKPVYGPIRDLANSDVLPVAFMQSHKRHSIPPISGTCMCDQSEYRFCN